MIRRVAVVLAALVCAPILLAGPADAASVAFPTGSGWSDPLSGQKFENWGFGSCSPPYVSDKAHLGTDSQGAPVGAAVKAMYQGTVVQITGFSTGKAVSVEHVTKSGKAFIAVYGHIDPTIGLGASVKAGTKLGTLTSWPGNQHLHLGIRPLSSGENPNTVAIRGSSTCTNGSAPRYGFVDPIPWLKANPADTSTPLYSYRGKIVQWSGDTKSQKTSWLVGADLKRRWISSSSIYNCLKGRAQPGPTALGSSTLDRLADLNGVHASCATAKMARSELLVRGQTLYSSDSRFRVTLQSSDSNLVVYGPSGATWSTGAKGADYLVFQTDGNLVARTRGGHPVWNSGTAGSGATRLTMQNDGNLVLYTSGGTAKWSTKTGKL